MYIGGDLIEHTSIIIIYRHKYEKFKKKNINNNFNSF